jgi:hypothetical protein
MFSTPSSLGEFLTRIPAVSKPRIFVSYHHQNDQVWYDRFSGLFGDHYELFTDTSIGRKIDSDDPVYQSRKIREDHIAGSSITILLIGTETWKRKHVDWEIHATLEKKHALLGIVLPTHTKNQTGEIIVPDRFLENFRSGFATWTHWSEMPNEIANSIAAAKRAAINTYLIRNNLPQLERNRS